MANQLPGEGQLKAFVGGTAGNNGAAPLALCVGVVDGRPYAIDSACPHARASLAGGSLCGTAVECPVHGWQWNLATGEPLRTGDPPLQTYEVRQYGNEVFVRIGAGKVQPEAAENIC